ncbi:ABC transporter ATP-binding protein [Nocardioides massiliensis]|uniref:ABC-2 type transport system ATP-binding protein n=1 Tax=Nocardioides massiliensis TaxID=1325935 RepID=A0ABT9NTK6_9ACTN|nr:ATP-binding cassette domain-containing protein [Nocardioides massiliensis]MDP9823746.1 ABC-2 type transport system ATP-binding protein [Nocardioides massiliensis]
MLSIHQLTRAYGDKTVLDAVSFEVRPGRMTGFVGANGAGKTTTMRMIVGVLAPTAGDVRWNGAPLSTEQRRSFGYMPEERGLYPGQKVLDQLIFFGQLHGMTRDEARDRAQSLLARLGLTERENDLLETLSLGNQQRVQIAASLIHRPTALILDEPFSGLDPIAVDAMVALLRDEVTPEMPVLFSSHQLDLVERLCDDLVILSGGRLVAAGSVEELQSSQDETYRIRYADGADAGALRDLPGLRVLDADGSTALVALDSVRPEQALVAAQAVAPVTEFARVVRPLSQIFREATS